MVASIKGLRIYLDTHIIDYLYDYSQDYWEDSSNQPNISKLAEIDLSGHINELVSLYLFLMLTYVNDITLLIGDRVFDELERIPEEDRKSKLIRYAEGIRHFYSVYKGDPFDRESEHKPQYYTTFLSQVLAKLNKKDRPLYTEAIEKKCSYFLTTDKQVGSLGNISILAGLEITSPLKFVNGIFNSNPEALNMSSYEFVPELSFFSWLIPNK